MLILLFIFGYISQLIEFSSAGRVNLRHSQSNKQFISQLDEGSFEIVHPFQVRDKKERIGIDTHNYFLNVTTHYKQVTIVIRSNTVAGIRLKLSLTLNDYLFFNETQFKKLDENGESSVDSPVENCYYQGIVNNDPSSFVAISTCTGLWGIIAFDNGTTLGIWPLDGGDRGRRHPHVLYRTRWTRDAACGAVTQTPNEFLPLRTGLESGFSMLTKIRRDVTRQMKYLELAVFGDYNFMHELNATDREGIEYMLNIVNIADALISSALRLRLSVVYAEVWLDAQRVDLHNDIQRTLSGTVEYITGHIYHVEKDASIMFTGGHFVNSEMITAAFSSVCTARAVGVVKNFDSYAIHSTAQLISHAVGHIIGIDHDSSECVCRENGKCLMNRQVGAIGSPFSWEFSKCSVARLHNVLQSEHFQCLLTRPFQSSQLQTCGNGVIDGDEECDCGRRDECDDSCCDPITCTLRAHARCASHQACCHHCELRPSGYICRESKSLCDVAESCDGISGDCLPDGHLIDGVMCGINGHCWKGNCSDSEQQCKDLWGKDASLADEPCFDSNQKGVEYGNCGANRNGEFLSCTPENQRCGTLHCKDGNAVPQPSTLMSFNLQFVHNAQQIQCKAIIGSESEVALVKDGTSCSAGKICIENACVPLAQVSAPVYCPSNNIALPCSGHGDCTTTQKCLCYDGWTGAACDIRSNTSRRIFPTIVPPNSNELFTPFRVSHVLDTPTLLGILLIVGICLLMMLICLLLCYRRKSTAELHRGSGMPNKDEDMVKEKNNRAIKFGPTPSYSEEKRKQKKNKQIYCALQRINEAEERDSVSLRSRESSTVASIQNAGVVDAMNQSSVAEMLANGSANCQPSYNNDGDCNMSPHRSNLNTHDENENLRNYYHHSQECLPHTGLLQPHVSNFIRNESDNIGHYANDGSESQQGFYGHQFSSQNLPLQSAHGSQNIYSRMTRNGSQNDSRTNCCSPSRSDFCRDGDDHLLRRNVTRGQASSRNLFSERNGYATDSEVMAFCDGANMNYPSTFNNRGRFPSSQSSNPGTMSNRHSDDVTSSEHPLQAINGNNILSDTECTKPLNNGTPPPPPLRLQMLTTHIQSAMNDDNVAYLPYNPQFSHKGKLNTVDGMTSSSSNPNSLEMSELFISSGEPTFDRDVSDCDLLNRNTRQPYKSYNNQMHSQRSGNISAPEPPPASADSGHHSSNYDIQDSPSLFSDTFKLDLPN